MLLAALVSVAQAYDTWIYYNSSYITSAELGSLTGALQDAGATVTTSTSTSWPTSWTGYQLVIILLPGASFSTTQAGALETFVDDGGRLVVTGDWETRIPRNGFYTSNDYANGLMTSMGVGMQLNEVTVAGSGCTTLTGITSDTLTADVTSIAYASSNTVTGGTALFTSGSNTILAVDQPSATTSARDPYDVILSGDTNVLLGSCSGSTNTGSNYSFWYNLYIPSCVDDDGDGYDDEACGGDDCDDTDIDINPGAVEYCNGDDDDCDGSTDESSSVDADTWYRDADGDAYGSANVTIDSCNQPTGYVANDRDCDDGSATVNPAATETCNSLDDDCDGSTDETGGTTWYRDADGDGYGTSATTSVSCSAPTGYVSNALDCNDASAAISPADTETCNGVDDDCDGSTDESGGSTWYRDADSDGYGTSNSSTTNCSMPSGYVATATDCNDGNDDIHPNADEYCNSVDDDCDGSTDESAVDRTTYYRDADSDGYGTSATTSLSCSQPSGYVTVGTDCNDGSATIYPSAPEYCDSLDNDCDGVTDEDGGVTWYRDGDADGYGTSATSTVSCSNPTGYVANDDDCNDSSAAISPADTEVCNSVDDDCDGSTDESGGSTYYRDADADGYGSASTTTTNCTMPSGYVATATDCNDANDTVHPGADEYCNALDDDCDGSTDESAIDFITYYADSDGDGFGDATIDADACDPPTGYVDDDTDCDDADSAIYPGASEVCDGADNDCDGASDESGGTTWYADADADGYGNAASTRIACNRPTGYVANDTDCDDTDATVSPVGVEACNGVDDDCDSSIDEAGGTAWYSDSDSDGYGDPNVTSVSCTAPNGYVSDATDCDDDDNGVHPAATEACNSIDDDCDGSVDEAGATGEQDSFRDADGDGYGDPNNTLVECDVPAGFVTDGTDCDDTSATVNPGAEEICNSIDDDCDASVDEGIGSTWYADADGDGFGDPITATLNCSRPTGYVSDATDCDDTDGAVNPDAIEVCNEIDDDCDALIDEDDAYDVTTWFEDADGDGYGTSNSTYVACDAPSGYVGNDDDCWDDDSAVSPDGTETADGVDEDCDGTVDESTDWSDDDGDGYSEAGGDCDDASEASPSTVESCNSIDDDCDGTVDEGTSCYDDDSDGYTEDGGDCNDGDAAANPGLVEVADNGVDDDCDGSVDGGIYDPDGDGYTDDGGDCAEEDGTVYPGAEELPDGLDNDCDGLIDEGTSASDDDGDTYSEADGDCNDADSTVSPAATEVDNGVDDDCDTLIDEGGAATDDDGDGFSDDAGDCDDANAEINPSAPESDNDIDDDCDDEVDEDFSDLDGDGYSSEDGDCDDLEGWSNPGQAESCDGLDNNCDGVVDEACEEQEKGVSSQSGCGCASSPSPIGTGLAALVGLVALARRRRN